MADQRVLSNHYVTYSKIAAVVIQALTEKPLDTLHINPGHWQIPHGTSRPETSYFRLGVGGQQTLKCATHLVQVIVYVNYSFSQ